jgi:transcriptional regulator with XRE-family HTH domain
MQRAIELVFFDELTDEQIANAVGISRRALARWKKRDDFQSALSEFSVRRRERAHEVLDATVEKAAYTLRELLDSDNEQVRLRAAAEVLKVTNTVSEPRMSGPTQVEVQVANFFQQLERPYIDATDREDR